MPPKNWGANETSNFWPLFSRLPHSTPHISGTKRHIDKPKTWCQSTMRPLKLDLLSVTFDPQTAEIRWLMSPCHVSIFRDCQASLTKATEPRPTLKFFGRFISKKLCPQPKLKFLANTFFATSALDTAYLQKETSHWQTKMLVSIYNVSSKGWPTFGDV